MIDPTAIYRNTVNQKLIRILSIDGDRIQVEYLKSGVTYGYDLDSFNRIFKQI